ncbi:MAG: hypothetical protein DCC72_04655 [Burkholderiales bacterium]|nr:MAG: hypothetical protein DCC72_04655 [Burkholderiales bacterium]
MTSFGSMVPARPGSGCSSRSARASSLQSSIGCWRGFAPKASVTRRANCSFVIASMRSASTRVARSVNSPCPSLSHATSPSRQAANFTSRMRLRPPVPPGAAARIAKRDCRRKRRCASISSTVGTTKRLRSSVAAARLRVSGAPTAKRVFVPEWQQSMKTLRFTASGSRRSTRAMSSSM